MKERKKQTKTLFIPVGRFRCGTTDAMVCRIELLNAVRLSMMKIHFGKTISSMWRHKSHSTLKITVHTPYACLTQSLSSISPSLPPLLDLHSLLLSPSLSQMFFWQSQGCSVVNSPVIYSLFSYQHCWVVDGQRDGAGHIHPFHHSLVQVERVVCCRIRDVSPFISPV